MKLNIFKQILTNKLNHYNNLILISITVALLSCNSTEFIISNTDNQPKTHQNLSLSSRDDTKELQLTQTLERESKQGAATEQKKQTVNIETDTLKTQLITEVTNSGNSMLNESNYRTTSLKHAPNTQLLKAKTLRTDAQNSSMNLQTVVINELKNEKMKRNWFKNKLNSLTQFGAYTQ